jgi:hypothetical protein
MVVFVVRDVQSSSARDVQSSFVIVKMDVGSEVERVCRVEETR